MKKLVMVMCFALCASIAFAQTKHATPRVARLNQNMVAQKSDNGIKAAKKDYKASIFSSKAAGDIIASWDFAAGSDNYTTGVVGSNQTIMNPDGSSVNMIQHTQTNGHAEWNRVTLADTASYRTTPVDAGGYPATYDWFENINYIDAQTPENGFMVMTMADQIAAWGGSGVVGNFDAYVALNAVSTSGIGAVLMYLYQAYRCFNSDQNFIDYSTNGTTWYQYEINVRGVDVAGNSWLAGQKKIMLPAICGNQANLYLRIRWACDNNGGGAYGYIWMFDDVSLVEPEANDVDLLNSQYYTGLYHQMPQNMEVPITWWASLRNMGTNNQANVTIALNHLTADSSTMSQVAALTYGPLNATIQVDTAIDGHGYGTDNGWYVPGNTSRINTAAALYPTANEGDHFIVASYEATNIPIQYQDTIFYQVNALQPSPDGNGQVAVWAMDNGVLTPYAYDIDGMVQQGDDWYLSTGLGDPNPSYTKPGYDLWNRFVTGSNVPDNWVIRGMQLVAATKYSATDPNQNVTIATGAHITASLYKDSIGDLFNKHVETGALTYETKIADYNYYYLDGTELGRVTRDENTGEYPAGTGEYMLPGQYNVINIMFPEQPELEPRTSYHLGYELIDGFFAVAGQSTRYVHHYDGDPADSLYYVYFSADTLKDGSSNVLRKYGRTFHPGHEQNQMQFDPDHGLISRGSSDLPPMIRMLVGPRVTLPTFNVSVECEGYEDVAMSDLEGSGVFRAGEGYDVCGQTVEFIQHSSGSYTVGEAESGYRVYQVWVNGEKVYEYKRLTDDPRITHRESSGIDLVYFSFEDFTEDATIKYVFGEESAVEVYYTINAVPNNEAWGSVTGGGVYADQSTVTLTATPKSGYRFVRWDDNSTMRTRMITVSSDATYTAYFEAGEGINDVASNVSMSLYPNPANNNVKLDITGVNGNVNCTILDMSGRVVYSQSINAEEATTINVSNFAKGAYFVRITNNEFTKVEKLVVR